MTFLRSEFDVANISIDDSAVIKLNAFPDEKFTSAVTEIDLVGIVYLGDITYNATITLNDPRFL